jgi:hypothetical protein
MPRALPVFTVPALKVNSESRILLTHGITAWKALSAVQWNEYLVKYFATE